MTMVVIVGDDDEKVMMMMNMRQGGTGGTGGTGGGEPSHEERHQNDFDDGVDDDHNNKNNNDDMIDIEIVPLVPPRQSFFQRSTSSNSSSSAGMKAASSTIPASLGGFPVRQQQSSSSLLERQQQESNVVVTAAAAAADGGGRRTGRSLQRILCWIICCCSGTDNDAVMILPEEVRLLLQAMGALCFAWLGWYIPRFMIQNAAADIIHKKVLNYQTTAAGDVILDALLNQPYIEPPTIPSHVLLWTSLYIPLVLVLLVSIISAANNNTSSTMSSWTTTTSTSARSQRPKLQSLLHHVQAACGGFCTAIGASEGLTQLLKLYIQRKRPNFFALCDFERTVLKVCTAEPASRILEANFSCPSGHSSLAACGMTFLALHMVANIIALTPLSSLSLSSTSPVVSHFPTCLLCRRWMMNFISQRKQLSCLVVVIGTSSWAMFVGASRVVDQWHHPSDVVAGLVLGCFCSVVAYHAWFPPVWFHILLLPVAVNNNNNNNNTYSSSSNNNTGTWTSVAGVPWSLITAATDGAAAAGATRLPMVDGKLPSFHE
jgi:membrane-associated phospholipid phosphatase